MTISEIAKLLKLTPEQVYKACDSMGIQVQSSIKSDGAVLVRFTEGKVFEWDDVKRLHNYACGFLGFDPCK